MSFYMGHPRKLSHVTLGLGGHVLWGGVFVACFLGVVLVFKAEHLM